MSKGKPDTPETPHPPQQEAPEVEKSPGAPVPKELPLDDPLPGGDRKGD